MVCWFARISCSFVDVLLFWLAWKPALLALFRSLDLVVLNASFAQPHSAVGGGLFRKPRALLLRRLHPNIDIDLCNRYNVAASYPRQTSLWPQEWKTWHWHIVSVNYGCIKTAVTLLRYGSCVCAFGV